jgi:hypothetical protein
MKSGIYRSPNGNLIYVGSDRTVRACSLSPSSWPGARVTMREKDSECYIEGLSYRFVRVGDVPYGFSHNPQQALDKYREETRKANEELFGVCDPDSKISSVVREMQRGEDPMPDPARVEEKTARIAASARSGYEGFAEYAEAHGKMSGEASGVSNLPRRTSKSPALGAPYGGTLASSSVQGRAAEKMANTIHNRMLADGLVPTFGGEYMPLREAGYRRCHAKSARKHKRRGDDVIRLAEGVYAWRPVLPQNVSAYRASETIPGTVPAGWGA